MVPAPPPLPTRFPCWVRAVPCWVRAVYSWGGESKRDLGFIEGDLIECLNAGDGSWWTGRLWRDRRAIGLFPSNFVERLPDNFRPTTRGTSPLPASNTPSPKGTPQKSRTFRKPFEAYAKAPHYTTAKIPETWKDGLRPRDASANSFEDRGAETGAKAMDDVMEQLDALGAGREPSPEPEPAPLDPWSPASFDMVHHRSRKKRELRPATSMGIPQHVDEGYETYSGSAESPQEPAHINRPQENLVPHLSNYVDRIGSRLRTMQQHSASMLDNDDDVPPPPPPKGNHIIERPKSSMGVQAHEEVKLKHKKSAYEISRQVLNRTFTTKTNSTNSSSATQSTDRSLMSGVSAGGISATSAGSLARKNRSRAQSALAMRDFDLDRPGTPFTGVTYHSSHASGEQRSKSQIGFHDDPMASVGGLVQPKPKKQNFIKRILESAKTGVASTRGISTASSSQGALSGRSTPALPSLSGPLFGKTGREPGSQPGLGGGVDWVQVRRDVNRSNSLSQNELLERKERCQMLDYPALDPVEELYSSIDGDEGADGRPVAEPINYQAINLSQVDKNSRFLANLPPTTTPITLATTYVCRPYRSDVQRLRSIFTWVAEKICWEEDFDGPIDTRRVIQTKRACAEEYAALLMEMCAAVGLTCEMVRGYLKTPGEIPEVNIMPRSNHWWNAVLVDDEWRLIDCCLASPSNPRRALYSSYNASSADPWWFLTRPTELCWTHIAELHAQQHICPPVAHETLLNLPCACPPYFKNDLHMLDYNTSLTRIEDLEMLHVKFSVPADVEVAAEVEVRAYSRDADGDFFESGDTVRKRALAQAEWFQGVKRYTVKALLPGDEGAGVLRVYAGKRGLMHSIKDVPHPLAFALPIIHTGENPPYEFVVRHPTPHAQRHDIYVVQPQCQSASPIPFARPGIETTDLTYTFQDHSTGISHISLSLPPRSRTLLIGANGAGKTTLLRLLAGKRLAPANTIRVSGVDPFKEGLEGVTYLGLEWVLNAIVRTDIGVGELLRSVGGDVSEEG
ncbi:hypothetical protein N0V88_002369 [Collariella sp. IMI 366227]|nr:hypothetical protein N0V88_002369 [Collariella sp. IMI 366227]